MYETKEKLVREWQRVDPQPPLPASKVGIALGTLGKEPINGLRHLPEKGTNGWFLWCGSIMPAEDDAFSPLHIEHIGDYLPQVEAYLCLPPGYRFLVDGDNYEDVWFDPNLLAE